MFRVWGLGFRVQGVGCRVDSLGFGALGVELRVQVLEPKPSTPRVWRIELGIMV